MVKDPQDPRSRPRPPLTRLPDPTRPGRKSRLRALGRSGPRGPFSLVGSAPRLCTVLLPPSGAGETPGGQL